MHPILFELPGGFPLRSFGLMVVLGFLLGSHLYGRLGRRYSADPEATAAGYASVPSGSSAGSCWAHGGCT